MTQQQAYEELRARLNKMFPERLELKFGCEVFDETGAFKGVYVGTDRFMWRGNLPKKEIEVGNILGIPITLQEILRGIDVARPNKKTYMVRYDGELYDERNHEWVHVRLPMNKDPKDWPLETLQWLLEVILDDK